MGRGGESLAATRKIGIRDGAELWAVKRVTIEVVRGRDRGRTVELAGERPAAVIGTDRDAELALRDDSVSHRHAEVSLEAAGYVLRDLGSTNGTRVGGVAIREAVLDQRETRVTLGETELRVLLRDDEEEQRLSLSDRFGDLVGRAPAMRRVFELMDRAARGDATVLLLGESGTGKELLAEALHARSPRAEGPLVVVDCSALTSTLAESELFGHVRGAFTGADAHRAGAFEEASGGTLFLDEIGELPLEMQSVLLRALAEREVKAVGSDRYRPVDVRVVAATHRDLTRAVAEGAFRADLFYRIAVVKVTVPPLRQRREDIPLIAREIVRRLRPGADPDSLLAPGVLAAFSAYAWPGNVRELRNAIERLLVVGDAGDLIARADGDGGAGEGYAAARRRAIDRFERDYVAARLEEAGGVTAQAAARAGISRQMFHRLVRRHGVLGDE
ncbi:MAG TPA: sigma 54-interacting transcriptional regulator [Kofleriaceae bacterium]|nr:sigma 54-interacting transcriptional regulator [Kofleriaceae bacterium]